MIKALKKEKTIWHYVDGKRVEGAHSDVYGNLSDVRGNLSDVRGDLSGVHGDLSGVRGDLSDVYGDIDDCKLTDKEIQNGVDIEDLIIG